MKRSPLIIICTMAISLNGLGQKSTSSNQIAKMKWLVGSWQGTYNGAPFYEAWRRANDSVMINFAIEIKNKDTIVKEAAVIRLKGKDVFYGGADAQWKLTELSDASMTFSNDTLKFSNKIVWSHSKDDHWLATLHNPNNRIVNYDLVRVPWMEKHIDAYISKNKRK